MAGKPFASREIRTDPPCASQVFACAFHPPTPTTPPKIQLSAKDFENEKMDRQSMQHQLHKVLKELRKARDQISKLESAVSVFRRSHKAKVFGKLLQKHLLFLS